jgi:hypothetical protein
MRTLLASVLVLALAVVLAGAVGTATSEAIGKLAASVSLGSITK